MLSRVISLTFVFILSACGTPDVEVKGEENHKEKPRVVKVVVVTLFEIGDDTGDRAGEFQLWKERRQFDEILTFHGYKDLHYNSEDGLLVMVTGIGTARAAAATARGRKLKGRQRRRKRRRPRTRRQRRRTRRRRPGSVCASLRASPRLAGRPKEIGSRGARASASKSKS